MRETIYLQICKDEDSELHGEVTWCEDQINPDDTEYVRADIVEELRTKLAEAEKDAARLDWLQDHDGRFYHIDRISAIVGNGFSSTGYKTRTDNLREAIDQAMKEQL